MIKNKFCIVGIDNDFEEFIIENKGNYLGLISNYKKNYKITKRAGKENLFRAIFSSPNQRNQCH